jgi:hypothetical protein
VFGSAHVYSLSRSGKPDRNRAGIPAERRRTGPRSGFWI